MKLGVEQHGSVEAAILKQVRAQPGISRIALARKLHIAPSTIGNYAGRLITEGFLIDSEKVDFETGRPPTALRLNPAGGQFIGVDFEARNIMATAVDFSDRPLKSARQTIEKSDSVPEILEKIQGTIAEVLPEDRSQLLAIGVGAPGLVNPAEGIALDYKYIAHWKNVSLAAPLAKRFGVPVHLENTVRAMTLAEMWFGQGRGLSDWLCFGIRSGLGVGIVAGGQLQRGTGQRAGEIGRWSCPASSRLAARFYSDNISPSAEHLELQEVVSVRALVAAFEKARLVRQKSVLFPRREPLVFEDLVRAARQQDPLTAEIVAVAAEMLGWAVSQVSLALNPSHVILTGPLTLMGDILLQPLRCRAQEILRASAGQVPVILNSTLGEFSGALGAAALAVHEWKPSRSVVCR